MPALYQANVGALSIEFSNPRHAHEYAALKRVPFPKDMILIPGVVESTSNFVEHPEVVARRIEEAVAGDRRPRARHRLDRLRLRHLHAARMGHRAGGVAKAQIDPRGRRHRLRAAVGAEGRLVVIAAIRTTIMIDLYTWTTPNGRKISIALEELGLPYTAHAVDIGKDEQFKPEFLKISPNNRIPAIVDRDNGMSLMEFGAILIYLADKTGKLLPKDGEARYRVIEWLMWQMGGPGPMLGQVHHFVKYNKGKAPYAEERYLKEAHRLYGVLDRRLAGREYRRRRIFDRRHRHLAVDLALRMANHRSQCLSERQALV